MSNAPSIISAAHAICAMGEGVADIHDRMRDHGTAIERRMDDPVPLARIPEEIIPDGPGKIHKLLDRVIGRCLEEIGDHQLDHRWACVLSTTKGDIEALDRDDPEGAILPTLGEYVQHRLGLGTSPWIVSNACCSGTSALALGDSLIRKGHADHVIVVGVDILSPFVIEGFRALNALDEQPCRPFDNTRSGTTLGEACAIAALTRTPSSSHDPLGMILGHGIAHDANHLSGPSRTGEGLFRSIRTACSMAGMGTGFAVVNAHGTGTEYNDAMEALAFQRSGLTNCPISTYKGWFGHTLGAAGLLETLIATHALREGHALRNEGMHSPAFMGKIDTMAEDRKVQGDLLLKTSSGFGGSNAAIIIQAYR